MSMNEYSKHLVARPPTQAAEGLPRWRWTLEEFDALVEHGILKEDDRIELIGGELVPMSPKGNRHDLLRDELQDMITETLPRSIRQSGEIGWRPNDHTYLEPDIIIYPRGFFGVSVPALEVLVLIEVADTSLKYDLGHKARVYASLGVREYWVVNAKTLETTVHLGPGEAGYRAIKAVAPSETLTPHLLPSLGLSLGALKIE